MPKVVPGYKAEARSRILAAAQRLFLTKGFRRTTMDDVAVALGVSKGALYLYFRSKVDLLRAIQAENREMSRRWMAEALAARNDPARRFSEMFDAEFVRSVHRQDIALFAEIMAEASHDEEIRAAIRVDRREDLRSLRSFLAELRRRGLLASHADLDVLAFTITSLFEGAVWNLSLGLERGRTVRQLRSALNEILAPPERPRGRTAR